MAKHATVLSVILRETLIGNDKKGNIRHRKSQGGGMNWLDGLERRFPRLAMPGLLRMVSLFMLLTFGLNFMRVTSMDTWLLNGDAIRNGQIWRIVTFLFVPLSRNPFFLIFELMILVMIGDGPESAWGAFKLTLYYLCGAVMTLIIAFLVPAGYFGSYYLNLTLFMAFATVFPDYEILLFFIIPIKVKYLAMFSGAFIVWDIIVQPLPIKIVALLSVGNYLLFFGPAAIHAIRHGRAAYERRRQFTEKASPREGPRHVCVICGRNEQENPDLQFRYCTCPECGETGVPYCLEHLGVHKGTLNKPSIH